MRKSPHAGRSGLALEPLDADPFGNDDHLARAAVVEQLGQLQQQRRVVLHRQRARVEQPRTVGKLLLASPGVVARPLRQLVQRRPVVNDVDPRRVDAPPLEHGAKVLGNDDQRIAAARTGAVEAHEVLADGVTEHGDAPLEQRVRGDAVDVLHPEHVPHAAATAVSHQPSLRDRRRVGRQHDVGSKLRRGVRQQVAVFLL